MLSRRNDVYSQLKYRLTEKGEEPHSSHRSNADAVRVAKFITSDRGQAHRQRAELARNQTSASAEWIRTASESYAKC